MAVRRRFAWMQKEPSARPQTALVALPTRGPTPPADPPRPAVPNVGDLYCESGYPQAVWRVVDVVEDAKVYGTPAVRLCNAAARGVGVDDPDNYCVVSLATLSDLFVAVDGRLRALEERVKNPGGVFSADNPYAPPYDELEAAFFDDADELYGALAQFRVYPKFKVGDLVDLAGAVGRIVRVDIDRSTGVLGPGDTQVIITYDVEGVAGKPWFDGGVPEADLTQFEGLRKRPIV